MTETKPVYETDLPLPRLGRGKVRDIYEAGDRLLLAASDRLSAFDVVFPDPIPRKGEVLNRLSAWWFAKTAFIVPNHLISAEPAAQLGLAESHPEMIGRCSLVRRASPLPVECVVRGYLEGSAWKDYLADGAVSGVILPAGLCRSERLLHPIFTPSTKAETGHDEPISFEQTVDLIGVELAEQVRHISIQLYKFAHELMLPKGIVLSDTKFEFGVTDSGELILIDEALTPDSSRFWEADSYRPGGDPRSYDKQYVRDYVEKIGWDKRPPAPSLPAEVSEGMTKRYCDIFERITGAPLDAASPAAAAPNPTSEERQ